MAYSPGVRQREFDDSLYATASGGTKCGVVITAYKGPMQTRTTVTSPSEFIAKFGEPTTQGGYFALQFLRRSNNLVVVRTSDGTELASATQILKGATPILDVDAITPGTWGDELSVQTLAATDGNAGHVNIYVLYEDVVVERFTNVASFAAAEALVSEYVTFEESAGSPAWPADWAGAYTSYDLAAGANGTTGSVDYIGNVAVEPTTPATGLHMFDNVRDVLIDLLAVPGISDEDVVLALLAIAEDRGDCIALIDPPDELEVSEAMEWVNGDQPGGVGPATALNTSFAATSYPWHKYHDDYNDTDVYIAPSGPLAAVMANSENLMNVWAAPAGRTRGKHPYTKDLRFNPSDGDIAKAYGEAGQNINWWVNIPNFGIVLWGQKTLQRTSTALDRLNVRRLLNFAKREVDRLAQSYVFEPNDETTWRNIIDIVTSVLEPIKAGRGLADFRVLCDATINTDAVVEKGELRVRIMIKPTKTAEWLTFDWVISAQSAVL